MGRPKQFDTDHALEQAMQVFWRKGYADTTPQDLVDAMGIGKGSLYHTFGSKHALFERALHRYRDGEALTLIEMLERSGPVKERLRDALENLVRMDMADPDRRGCMMINTAAQLAKDTEAADIARRAFARTEMTFQAVLEEGRRSGEIGADSDTKAIGSLLFNTVVGLRLTSRVIEGPEYFARVIDAMLAAV